MPHALEDLISSSDIKELAISEQLRLDDRDRIALLETMRTADVQACPGSGKTTLIAAKLILLAQKWPLRYQGICVLSHTNVAKDEIIARIRQSRAIEAERLLAYPHFIGTIQEFVGKFIAFPQIRSAGTSIKLVDTDACIELIYSGLQPRTRNYVNKRSLYSNVLYDFDLIYADDKISINVPTFPAGSTSQSYLDLLSVRKDLIKEGCFFYRDIFTIALKALRENQALPGILRQRFQYVFIDEMQDTQKYQDELLLQVFPLEDPSIIVQRFGDPDQAIFQGIGSEEPNESFNGKSRDDMDFVLYKSYRFGERLAVNIRNLSLNEIPLASELPVEALDCMAEAHVTKGRFEHTIIIFNDETLRDVVTAFADIICNQFAAHYRNSPDFRVKVVGAVGNKVDPDANQLKIGHYWPHYDKTKSRQSFKATSLLEAVHYCRLPSSTDLANNYRFLIDCILKLLRMAHRVDENGQYYSAMTLRQFLEKNSQWAKFRKEIYWMLNDLGAIDQESWEERCSCLKNLLALDDIPLDALDYLSFTENLDLEGVIAEIEDKDGLSVISLQDNRIQYSDGFQIELSTIHGAKGETHDATLVVETKNHVYDLETMLPYLTKELPSAEISNSDLSENPNSRRKVKANRTFMRQLYVAMSRPRHLLCIAVHSDHISTGDVDSLRDQGWRIEILQN